MHELTEEDFKYFTQRVLYYKKLFGLQHLTMKISLGDDDEEEDFEDRVADFLAEDNSGIGRLLYSASAIEIKINQMIDSHCGDKQKDIDEVAFHEVFEAGVLGGLIEMASWDKGQTVLNEIKRESHAILNRVRFMMQNLYAE